MISDKLLHNVYFANLQGKQLTDAIHHKIDQYYDYINRTNLFYLWKRSYKAYYGSKLTGASYGGVLQFGSAELSRSGRNGELIDAKVNHFRSLLKHTNQLITEQKPALSCRSNNSDYRSQAQTLLGNGLLDYYMQEKKVAKYIRKATEISLIFGEGFVYSPWDPNLGERYWADPESGQTVYEGDLSFSIYNPLDVPRETNLKDDQEHDWHCIKTKKNKFDLIAQFPELKDKILAKSSKTCPYETMEAFTFGELGAKEETEQVVVWVFYHRKTESVPDGRIVMFTGDITLIDTPNPYQVTPIHRISPENIVGTIFGWSPAFDLLAPQQMLDILNSTIITNQSTYGVQNIWTKTSDAVESIDIGGGMRNLQSDEMPKPLQLTQTAAEIFNYRGAVAEDMQLLSGINATVRGNPQQNIESGTAMALIVSQATQYMNLLEASYSELIESIGISIIKNLQQFATTKRVANIIGESNRSYQKEFKAEDINAITRVAVEQVNPLSKTVAGRVQMAENYANRGWITGPSQYAQVQETGNLKSITDPRVHEELNIKAENERLRNGQPVTTLITDIHADHIREHRALLSDPEARENPELVNLTLMHLQEHYNLWQVAPPALLFATGQQPCPAPMMGPPQPGLPSGPPGDGAPLVDPQGQLPAAPNPAQPPQQVPQEAPPEAQAAYEKTIQQGE